MSCRALLFIFLLPVLLSAQTVVSVDSDITRNSGKSMPLALGASALLPGMGELYLGESSYTRPFVWVDASLWMTTIVSYIVGERYITSAHNYASRYAGLNTSSKKMSLLNAVGDYRSRSGVKGQNSSPDDSENYNQAMLRAGKAIDSEFKASIDWDWGSSDNPETTNRKEHYKDLLGNYRISRMVFQIAVGALVVNRIASVLNTMRIYRATSSSGFSSLDVSPRIGLEGERGIDFSVRF